MKPFALCLPLLPLGCCYGLLTPASFARKHKKPWSPTRQKTPDWFKSIPRRPCPSYLTPAEEAAKIAQRPTKLVPRRTRLVTDWTGTVLNKRILHQLKVGDTVRVQVEIRDTETGEELCLAAPYFTLTKVKALKNKRVLLWGEAENVYGTIDYYPPELLQEGQIFPFSTHHILEIPTNWHPRQRRKQLKTYLRNKSRCYTGVF